MIGKIVIELDRVDSTNDFAFRLLAESSPEEGTVIRTREQYAGRGQNENRWHTESGRNLILTVVLYPRFLPPDAQFLLNKCIALGILDFLAGRIPQDDPCPPSIKWPNDLYLGNKKVGGVLISHRIMGSLLDCSVVGVGLNINQEIFPAELPNPVSLKLATGREYDLDATFSELCSCLSLRYTALKSGDHVQTDSAYQASLLGYGAWRQFTTNSETFEGMITGVDDMGQLLIKTRDGRQMAFMHKEVEMVL